MYVMKIELKSNLCVADGDGYATVIDTDIVADKYGIPFIPARRLKGCLRDAAKYIYGDNSKIIDDIFGISGDYISGALKIENAVISEYDSFKEMVKKNNYPSRKVTELFTSTSASTAIEDDGKAQENSLRFMRYVSKEKAWNENENLVFCSLIDIDECYAEDMKKICKALRHIGYKRNRGFGFVKCSLEQLEKSDISYSFDENFDDDKEYELTYAIKLKGNMMLPAKTSDTSMDYISGRNVLGFFAGKYLKNHEADKIFDEIFLMDNLKFSNLYITNEKYEHFVPVPQIYGKTKQSKRIVDMAVEKRGNEIVKPIKSGFINKDLELKKVLTERIYHNNMANEKGGLYTQNCIQSGQVFMGSVIGKGSYIKIISGLLKDGKISFGRSKSAEYSGCELVGMDIREFNINKVSFKRSEKIIYLFESDVILSDEYGNNNVSIENVCKALDIDVVSLKPESALNYKTVHGYLSVMRMQRAHIKAISAGSVLVISTDKNIKKDEIVYIGGNQNEGYGKIRIFKAGKLLKDSVSVLKNKAVEHSEEYEEIKEMFKKLSILEQRQSFAVEYAHSKKTVFINEWGAAFIGRVSLMAEQAVSENDFEKRINSIKTDSKRELARKFWKDSDKKLSHDIHYKNKNWSEQQKYLLTILTLAKYFLKEKKGDAE